MYYLLHRTPGKPYRLIATGERKRLISAAVLMSDDPFWAGKDTTIGLHGVDEDEHGHAAAIQVSLGGMIYVVSEEHMSRFIELYGALD
jgi:hypothetical protein